MNYPWQATVQDDQGNAVVNPVVTVWEADGVTLATIYDVTGVEIANPITGSLEGFVQFWAADGEYRIEGASGSQDTEVWSWVAGVDLSGIESDISDINDRIDSLSGGGVGPAVGVSSIVIDVGVQAIDTNGYYSAGDAGGATYVRAPSEPFHGGKLQSSDGAWWELSIVDGIRVEMFGAKGDGVQDESSYFNAMDGYLVAKGGGSVVLLGLYYLPNGWVTTASNVKLEAINGAQIIITAGLTNHGIFGVGLSNWRISGLKVYMAPGALRNDSPFGIHFHTCTDIVIENCYIQNTLSGIWMVHCDRCFIRSNTIRDTMADGIHLSHGCHDSVVIGNFIHNTGDDAISCTTYEDTTVPGREGWRTKRIVIANNVVNGTWWGSGAAVHDADDVLITGNNIYGTATNGIVVGRFLDTIPNTNITISGNSLSNCGFANVQPDHRWYDTPLPDPVSNEELAAGIFVNESVDLLISGNKIRNVSGTETPPKRTGILLRSPSSAAIKGNYISNILGEGIAVKGTATDLHITDNSLNGVSVNGIDCIVYSPTLTGTTMIVGNVFTNQSGYSIRIGGTSAPVQLRNNVNPDNPIQISGATNVYMDADWTNFSPSVSASTGVIGSYTVNAARYTRRGREVTCRFEITISDIGTGAGGVNVSLPFNSVVNGGVVVGREITNTGKAVYGQTGAGIAQVFGEGNTFPATSGSVLVFMATYEAS